MLPQIRKTENAISAESNVRSLSLRRFPTPVMYFMVSVACIEPVIPGTGPKHTGNGTREEARILDSAEKFTPKHRTGYTGQHLAPHFGNSAYATRFA